MLVLSEAEEKRYAELQLMALDFAREGNTQTLQSMIDAGLPVNLRDHRGNSLLMLAAYNGNLHTVNMLLDKGADIERRNDHGQTPLSGVAFKGYLDICTLLVEAGADIKSNGSFATPLFYARLFGQVKVANYLLEAQGAKNRFMILPYITGAINAVIMKSYRLVKKIKNSKTETTYGI